MSVLNNRFPLGVTYIHLHTAAPPLQGPARTPPPGTGGVRCDLSPRDPLPLSEKTVLTGTHPSRLSIYISMDPSPSAGTHLQLTLISPRPTQSALGEPSQNAFWCSACISLYLTTLSVNLHFTSLLGFLGKLDLSISSSSLALKDALTICDLMHG